MTAGWGPSTPPYSWQAYEVPYLVFDPLGGSTSFADKLYRLANWNGNTNVEPGFCLPLLDLSNPSTPIYRTLWYCYINRGYTEWCTDPGISDILQNDEVANVLGPAYPNGCMVRVDLGALDFFALASVNLVGYAHSATLTTAAYTVDNADWQLAAGGSALPFTDEYHYLSTGGAGGKDTYQTQPALIEKQPDGSYLVIFTMMGVSDADLHDDHLMWAAARPFLYDPTTGIATQIARLAGPIYSDTDVGASGISGGGGMFYDDAATIVSHVGDTLYFWGHLGGAGLSYAPGTTYLTKFGTLTLTGDIGLDEIVGDICDAVDLVAATDYDVTPLATQRVRGYAVGRESDARAAIEPLQPGVLLRRRRVRRQGEVGVPRRCRHRRDRRGRPGGALRRRRGRQGRRDAQAGPRAAAADDRQVHRRRPRLPGGRAAGEADRADDGLARSADRRRADRDDRRRGDPGGAEGPLPRLDHAHAVRDRAAARLPALRSGGRADPDLDAPD